MSHALTSALAASEEEDAGKPDGYEDCSQGAVGVVSPYVAWAVRKEDRSVRAWDLQDSLAVSSGDRDQEDHTDKVLESHRLEEGEEHPPIGVGMLCWVQQELTGRRSWDQEAGADPLRCPHERVYLRADRGQRSGCGA